MSEINDGGAANQIVTGYNGHPLWIDFGRIMSIEGHPKEGHCTITMACENGSEEWTLCENWQELIKRKEQWDAMKARSK